VLRVAPSTALAHFASRDRHGKPCKNKGHRFAARNEAFRVRERKPLKSLGCEIKGFRGIVCFQWIDQHFGSQHAHLGRPSRAAISAIETPH
jgi:hypothetical protein